VQAQILDKHGLQEGIGRIALHHRRLSGQRLGPGILGLTLNLVQPIEKDRSQVSFLGCHEGLPSLICNVACSRDGDDGIAQRVASEIAICFRAYLHRGRAMADAVAPGMSSRYYCDRDLRQPPRRRANILVDLWRASVGPFSKTLGAAIC
jgi:hypothetical protein